jgi:hypothetical protein
MPPLTIPIFISLYISQVKGWKEGYQGQERDVNPHIYSHVFPLLLSLQVLCGLERPNTGRLAPERENSMNHSGHLAKRKVGVSREAPLSQNEESGRAEGGPTEECQRVECRRGPHSARSVQQKDTSGRAVWTSVWGVGGWGEASPK